MGRAYLIGGEPPPYFFGARLFCLLETRKCDRCALRDSQEASVRNHAATGDGTLVGGAAITTGGFALVVNSGCACVRCASRVERCDRPVRGANKTASPAFAAGMVASHNILVVHPLDTETDTI